MAKFILEEPVDDPAPPKSKAKFVLEEPVAPKKAATNEYEDSLWQKAKDAAASIAQGTVDRTAGAVRGAGSIGATIMYPIDKGMDMYLGDRGPGIKGLVTGRQPLSRNEERRQAMGHALGQIGADTQSGSYQLGKVGAEIAGTMGVGGALAKGAQAVGVAPSLVSSLGSGGFTTGANLPATATLGAKAADMGVRALGGGITGGAAAGAIDPSHADTGAVVGAMLPPGVAALGKLGSGMSGMFSAGANSDLARTAISKYNIPLGYGDIAEGGATKGLRSFLNDVPWIGGIGAAQKKAIQRAYNKAVGGQFGAPEEKLTAAVVDAAKKRMGAEFDRLWNGNALQVDGQLMQRVMDLQRRAAKLPKNEGASLNAELNDLMSKMTHDANGNLVVPGDVANAFQSYLRRRAEGSAGLKNELGDLRQSVISAFNRGIRPEDAAALTKNRGEYKAFKTVEPLLNKGEAGVAGREAGDVPAALLPQAVDKSYSNAAGVPMAELSSIGSRFLVDRTSRAGGSARAMIQNTALGSALALGGLTNPVAASMAIPAAAVTNKLLGSPALAEYLLQQQGSNALAPYIQAGLQRGFQVAPLVPAISSR